jgi:hypothetical protein
MADGIRFYAQPDGPSDTAISQTRPGTEWKSTTGADLGRHLSGYATPTASSGATYVQRPGRPGRERAPDREQPRGSISRVRNFAMPQCDRSIIRIAHASRLVAIFALFAPPAHAADYPEHPIRIIIPFPPGGGTDVLTRLLQPRLERALGTQLIIDNRGGGGDTIGVTVAARAEPDGYSLLVTSANFSFAPAIYGEKLQMV